jgi:hypothetical protein
VPARHELGLGERQGLTGGDLDLDLHEVEPVDELRDRVLDLQAGVHLEEVELAVRPDEELARPGADVTAGTRRGDGDLAHALAHVGVDERARALLENLLVATLNTALALANEHTVPMRIGEDLDLDVMRPEHVLLEVDGVVAEARVFSPICRIAEAGGPMKIRPRFSHASTNSARSDKKP